MYTTVGTQLSTKRQQKANTISPVALSGPQNREGSEAVRRELESTTASESVGCKPNLHRSQNNGQIDHCTGQRQSCPEKSNYTGFSGTCSCVIASRRANISYVAKSSEARRSGTTGQCFNRETPCSTLPLASSSPVSPTQPGACASLRDQEVALVAY